VANIRYDEDAEISGSQQTFPRLLCLLCSQVWKLLTFSSSCFDRENLKFCQMLSSAWLMSAMRSSTCSVPMLRRMVDGLMCCSLSSSGESCEWVVVAGWIMRLFTSATFASSEKISRLSINVHASFSPPFISNVNIEPPPLGNRLVYRAWS